jgi:hypothetical protein
MTMPYQTQIQALQCYSKRIHKSSLVGGTTNWFATPNAIVAGAPLMLLGCVIM